jgi:hypothetical protein
VPAFGVVTCGKRAPEPFEAKFGPCLLEPGHADDVPCRFKNLEGPGVVSVNTLPVPDEIAEAVAELGKATVAMMRTRRNLRVTGYVMIGAVVANLTVAGWSLGRSLGWMP